MNERSIPETGHLAALHSDDTRIGHYEQVREDIRHEMKMRMRQRDGFAAQMGILLTLVLTVGIANSGYRQALILAPMLAIFYTLQIMHSYRKHDLLARYLKDVLEPDLSSLHNIDPGREWQAYASKTTRSGNRRGLFLWTMWVVGAGAMVYLWFFMEASQEFRLAYYIAAGAYALTMLFITLAFAGDRSGRSRSRHSRSVHRSATGAYLS
ncbi:hypothetical protein D7Z26_18030 [Cohnella endophytica]|uniref:DUF2270 domain-containing protein n=1 Tax=Cohnella endophytica TaxID=2419778 RepID=A0A494XLU1_9BACL|nr:hypothetical protein [Cohnella endophytica]RKP51667.1 hypothetical protein D7Z26_18030 [Cohnella endophytica]